MNKGEDLISTFFGGLFLILFIFTLIALIAAYPILGLIPISLLALAIWVLKL